MFNQRAKLNIRKNAFPLRVVEPWNSLPDSVIQAKSINTFKNRLDKFCSTQEILYDYEAPLTLSTGTGKHKLLILDPEEEDLIIEEPRGSCDQNSPKVS